MTRIEVSRTIASSPEAVFRAVADIRHLPDTVPAIQRVEILSERESGMGTRFRETRLNKGKEMTMELEVTEYEPHERVRMVTDSHGTVWDSVFTVRPVDERRTELSIVMDARAHAFLPKLLNPLMKGLFRKGLEEHMDAVKAYCESSLSP